MGKSNLESFCICLAVRQGLLIWGYTKLVASVIISAIFIYLSVRLFSRVPESYNTAVTFLQCITTTIPEMMDLLFSLILIYSAHKRNLKLLEIYLYYSITMLAVFMLVILLTACNMERFQLLHDMIFHHAWLLDMDYYALLGFGLGHICLQSYLMMLVRSEVLKLREVFKAKLARQKSSTSFRGLRAGIIQANCSNA